MHGLIISAPFGNYLRRIYPRCNRLGPYTTSTVGTYTLKKRAGFFKRWWRVLSTVRYLPRLRGWMNRLGLPNPGITSVSRADAAGAIVSVHGFSLDEWKELGSWAVALLPIAVEANLSCPNVTPSTVRELVDGCLSLQGRGVPVIAKLPPVKPMDFVRPLFHGGIRTFHLCNTLPTPGGGLSGKPLKPLSLWAVESVRQAFGEGVTIIGGGGVTSAGDVWDYRRAGADHVAVGSHLLNPLNWRHLSSLAAAANSASGARHVRLIDAGRL